MEGNRKKGKKERIIFIILISIILVLCAVICFLLTHPEETPDVPKTKTVEKNDGIISASGYETLELIAGQKKQDLVLPNPAENNCIFVFTLSLADGTIIWKSEDVLPGKSCSPAVLYMPLAAESYEKALLQVDCFTADRSRSELNKADIRLKLNVE